MRRAQLTGSLLRASRPLLRINLGQYARDVREAPFPIDSAESRIDGPFADRLLFIGDVGVMGYGVQRQGMTVCQRTAQRVAGHRGRGCEWESIAAPDLTVSRLRKRATLGSVSIDLALLMIGVPDVLLATRGGAWASDLQAVVATIRAQHGGITPIVFAGIPPLADFRPIHPVARDLIRRQTRMLNDATEQLAATLEHAAYLPFPPLPLGKSLIQDAFSWRTLHQVWAAHLAPAAFELLDQSDVTSTRG